MWNLSGESRAEIEAGGNLNRMRGSPVKQHSVATGGKENLLKIWDFNSPEKPTFTAKNVSEAQASSRANRGLGGGGGGSGVESN